MFEKLFKHLTAKKVVFYILLLLFIIFIFTNQEISLVLFASLVIACSLNPLISKISKKMSRTTASILVISAILLLLALFFVPIITLAASQINSFAYEFPDKIHDLNKFLQSVPLFKRLGLVSIDLKAVVATAANSTTVFIDNFFEFVKGLSSALLYFVASIIFIFYFTADKEKIKDTILKLFPKDMKSKANHIINIISKRIGGYVLAQSCAIASVGIVMLIGLSLFKVEYAILFALITAILDIVPVVGPAIALIICLIGSLDSGFGTLAIITFVFAAAQFIENNFVRPYAFSKFLNIHPIIIFVSLFVAAKYMGIVGVLFAPAIAATGCVLIEELYIKNKE